MKIEDVIIIGAGPAGLSCALQLNRYGIKPLIFEKDEIGGLLRNANLVENYLGFPDGITGLELIQLFKEQVFKNSIRVFNEEVNSIDFCEGFQIKTIANSYKSHILVLATGTVPKQPDDLNISSNVKDKVLYEILPIIDCVNKNIVIIGAGDLAFDYALNLGKNNKIILMNRSVEIKCIPVLQEKVKMLTNFQYFENAEICGIIKRDNKLLIEYKNLNTFNEIKTDYIIFAIGREANRNLITNKLKDSLISCSSTNKFFEIGDAANGIYRQTAIAAGDGIKAAMKIYEMLNGK